MAHCLAQFRGAALALSQGMTIRCALLALCVAASLPSWACSDSEPDAQDTGSCAEAPRNDIVIASVSIPGQGIWPEELVPATGGLSKPVYGHSGTGCDWSDLGYLGAQAIDCSGLATIVPTTNEGELEATLEGGAVVRFSMPGAVLPATGQIQLELSWSVRKSNPYGAAMVTSSSVARDAAGQLVWLVAPTADDQLSELLGAPIHAVRSCRTRFTDCLGVFERTVFDHVVESVPEQRIVAAEPTRIDTPSGPYLISWYSAEIEQKEEESCADADSPRSGSGVRALLQR
jgi:hypothetical protein